VPVRLTGLVAQPTQAEPHFAVNVPGITTENLAVTFKQGAWLPNGEAQLFFNHLSDTRPVAQVDNEPLTRTIQADGGNHLNTFGFQYLTHLGKNGDLSVWYAHQNGRWGGLRQDANALHLGHRVMSTAHTFLSSCAQAVRKAFRDGVCGKGPGDGSDGASCLRRLPRERLLQRPR